MTTKYIIPRDMDVRPFAEVWEVCQWAKHLEETQKRTKCDRDWQFIGIDTALTWLTESRQVCGFALSYDLPRDRWTVEIGADPCGYLLEPVRERDQICIRALAKGCLVAVKQMAKNKALGEG